MNICSRPRSLSENSLSLEGEGRGEGVSVWNSTLSPNLSPSTERGIWILGQPPGLPETFPGISMLSVESASIATGVIPF